MNVPTQTSSAIDNGNILEMDLDNPNEGGNPAESNHEGFVQNPIPEIPEIVKNPPKKIKKNNKKNQRNVRPQKEEKKARNKLRAWSKMRERYVDLMKERAQTTVSVRYTYLIFYLQLF